MVESDDYPDGVDAFIPTLRGRGEGRDPNHCKDQDNSTTMKKEMQEAQGRREGVE